VSIETVGLLEQAAPFGEVPDMPRVDDRDGIAALGERRGDGGFESSGGFHDHGEPGGLSVMRTKVLQQGGMAIRVVVEAGIRTAWLDDDIECGLGDIDPNKDRSGVSRRRSHGFPRRRSTLE
jgi:hypothetical protein